MTFGSASHPAPYSLALIPLGARLLAPLPPGVRRPDSGTAGPYSLALIPMGAPLRTSRALFTRSTPTGRPVACLQCLFRSLHSRWASGCVPLVPFSLAPLPPGAQFRTSRALFARTIHTVNCHRPRNYFTPAPSGWYAGDRNPTKEQCCKSAVFSGVK
ncbi:hypothetical protein IJ21_12570 [Paenibacillus sp. 32O-W]|nr:hypothetical protein IJ21_12570 [Paenibacillus sp. 32O-W]